MLRRPALHLPFLLLLGLLTLTPALAQIPWIPFLYEDQILLSGDDELLTGGQPLLGDGVAIVGAAFGGSEDDVWVYNETTVTPDRFVFGQGLQPSDLDAANDVFGHTLGLGGDTLVAGVSRQSNSNGTRAGAIYVFERDAGGWSETGKILASDGAAGDLFANSIAFDGTTLAASSRNGIYVLTRDAFGAWVESPQRLGGSFWRVAVDGGVIAVSSTGNGGAVEIH
ncbi:MAG: FG-GAP repeat protein, partial [Holophagales bacterium]|nr:FG-GAP repeat protein [Holophagales bacterium]